MNETLPDMNDQTVISLNDHDISDIVRGLPRKLSLALRGLTKMQKGSIKVTLPGGKTYSYDAPQPGPDAEAVLHNWGLVRRSMLGGSLGAAESYVDGDWDSPDLTSFLQLFVVNSGGQGSDQFFNRNTLLNWMVKFGHWFNRNSKRGSKRNISAHYDLGNGFYSQWLDPSMTYSSGLFQDGANSLEESQEHKYRSLARLTDIKPHHHVLEIGCGWGGFAEYAAGKIGCKVTCLTISREQHDFAVERMQKAGLAEKVTIKFQDYRDERDRYDRIASIEMFEAVGEKFWPGYFQKLRDCLKPDGKAGLQVITIHEDDFDDYRARPDFIQKYIFPGGMLPTLDVMKTLPKSEGLDLITQRAFGPDYAATLKEWRLRFAKAWPTIMPLGFDDRFKRMWDFYLHYCEAGFDGGLIDVRQMAYQRVS